MLLIPTHPALGDDYNFASLSKFRPNPPQWVYYQESSGGLHTLLLGKQPEFVPDLKKYLTTAQANMRSRSWS